MNKVIIYKHLFSTSCYECLRFDVFSSLSCFFFSFSRQISHLLIAQIVNLNLIQDMTQEIIIFMVCSPYVHQLTILTRVSGLTTCQRCSDSIWRTLLQDQTPKVQVRLMEKEQVIGPEGPEFEPVMRCEFICKIRTTIPTLQGYPKDWMCIKCLTIGGLKKWSLIVLFKIMYKKR